MTTAQNLETEFQQMNDQFSELYKKQDFKGIGENLYSENCHCMVPGMEAITGREEVQKCIESYYEKGVFTIKSTIQEVVPGGEDCATERSSYTWYNKEGAIIDEGKFVTLRRKENGKWFVYFNIFNSNKA